MLSPPPKSSLVSNADSPRSSPRSLSLPRSRDARCWQQGRAGSWRPTGASQHHAPGSSAWVEPLVQPRCRIDPTALLGCVAVGHCPPPGCRSFPAASTRSFSNARREAQSLSKESRGPGMSPAPSFHIWAPKRLWAPPQPPSRLLALLPCPRNSQTGAVKRHRTEFKADVKCSIFKAFASFKLK